MSITYRNLLALVLIVAVSCMMSTAAFGQAADLYKAKCASCHGADGKADTAIGKKWV